MMPADEFTASSGNAVEVLRRLYKELMILFDGVFVFIELYLSGTQTSTQ